MFVILKHHVDAVRIRMSRATGRLVAVVAALASAAAAAPRPAAADETPPRVYGVPLPSGSRVTSSLAHRYEAGTGLVRDEDDYVVLVERGRKVAADVVVSAALAFPPVVELLRSDGAVAATATVRGRRGHLAFTADLTDTYRVRVRSADELDGRYTISVSVTGPRGGRVDDPVPASDGTYRFPIAAMGDARISAQFAFRGNAPAPLGLTTPDGAPVAGSAEAFHRRRGALTLTRFRLPHGLPFGEYVAVFAADPLDLPVGASFVATVTPPRTPPRRARILDYEPWLGSVEPAVGVVGSMFKLTADYFQTPRAGVPFRVLLDGIPAAAEGPDPVNRLLIRGVVPAGVKPGVHDIALETGDGQVAVLRDAFTVVPEPVAESFEPDIVPAAGGIEVTIHGTGFRPGKMGVRIAGRLVPFFPVATTATTVTFISPPRDAGGATVGVYDFETYAFSDVPENALTWAPWGVIARVSPPVVNILGGETVALDGVDFRPTDRLLLETAVEGVFEEITEPFGTTIHRDFTAPPRPKGVYDLVVETQDGHRLRPVTLTYFSYTDASAALGLSPGADLDACSTGLGDFDGDGDADLFLTRRGAGPLASVSQTRVLRNDGAAGLTDVTASVFAAATAGDDWRGDRVQVIDVTADGRPDVVLATNDPDVPAAGQSHVRILVNEARTQGAAATDRVFRDRTSDVMAPARRMTSAYGSTKVNDVDDWRALDAWVGDLDGAGGVPEIVVTTDRTFANEYVFCTPYCASPYAGLYPYGMYWGGTRVFQWNPAARGGLGRFAYDPNRLPQKRAVAYPIYNPPPGVDIPACNSYTPCRGTFAPFTGERVAAGRIDDDAALDIAVLSVTTPTVKGAPTSALEVALFAPGQFPGTVSLPVDATPAITALGIDFRGGALDVGRLAWPGGSGRAPIAVARATALTGSALRLLRYVPNADPKKLGTFEDLTASLIPAPFGGESWQADALRFADVDGDGDDDLVLLSRTAPAGTASGLRILRNLGDSGLAPYVQAQIGAASADAFVGDVLTIGDLDGNGLPDYVVSRTTLPGTTPATRVLSSDR